MAKPKGKKPVSKLLKTQGSKNSLEISSNASNYSPSASSVKDESSVTEEDIDREIKLMSLNLELDSIEEDGGTRRPSDPIISSPSLSPSPVVDRILEAMISPSFDPGESHSLATELMSEALGHVDGSLGQGLGKSGALMIRRCLEALVALVSRLAEARTCVAGPTISIDRPVLSGPDVSLVGASDVSGEPKFSGEYVDASGVGGGEGTHSSFA